MKIKNIGLGDWGWVENITLLIDSNGKCKNCANLTHGEMMHMHDMSCIMNCQNNSSGNPCINLTESCKTYLFYSIVRVSIGSDASQSPLFQCTCHKHD